VATPFKSSYNDLLPDYSNKIQSNINSYQPVAPIYSPPTATNPSFSKSNNSIEVNSQKKI